jgi:hypothetical protein
MAVGVSERLLERLCCAELVLRQPAFLFIVDEVAIFKLWEKLS